MSNPNDEKTDSQIQPDKPARDNERGDGVDTDPATSGHSDSDSQAERNREDESPG